MQQEVRRLSSPVRSPGEPINSAEGSSTFIRNMGLPIHGWFRFSAGFSADWVRLLVEKERQVRDDVVLLDPFGGVGTAIVAGEEAGVRSYGIEAHPFICRIGKAKLLWDTSTESFREFAAEVLNLAMAKSVECPSYPTLIEKCYPGNVLLGLHKLRLAWQEHRDDSPASELTWLAITAILRICSPVGTAPWQYVLPSKTKQAPMPPLEAFSRQIDRMASDMTIRQMLGVQPTGKMFCSDARECSDLDDASISLVVTSPPYVNNYDYADATRLEMTFWGEIKGWGDLQDKVRHYLVRSCSQHASAEHLVLEDLLDKLRQESFFDELEQACCELTAERERHGGKKAYHLMVAAYFADMARVWTALRRVCKLGAKVCFVVGDSAPYGVYVPVERWLGELALHAGFQTYHFERVRDRNIKWKNRKHRVPLHEGMLWVKG